MTIKTISSNKCFGGTQGIYSHASAEAACTMRFAVYLPPQAQSGKVPVLYWLSGLTCTEENFTIKAGAQRIASELGLAIVVCDTSPRGLKLPGEADNFDFGLGAGFYLDATEAPWSQGYRMYSYVVRELPALILEHFPIDATRSSIFGHSMGGHGALTIAIKNPQQYRSVSALAPLCSPMRSTWGEKALKGYLGTDRETWKNYDSTWLIENVGWKGPEILVDQGSKDLFLPELKPQLLQEACTRAGVALNLRMQEGYDHSYYFVATFIEDHLRFHHQHLIV